MAKRVATKAQNAPDGAPLAIDPEELGAHAESAAALLRAMSGKARLRADRIVTTRRESQTIYYSLESEGARKLIELLYQLYCAPECGVEPKAENKERRSDDDR